jgi:hypothetical protein
MNLQGRDLSIGMQGDDVRLLQSELRQLALDVPDNEFQEAVFEPGPSLGYTYFRYGSSGTTLFNVGVSPTSSAVPYYSGGISQPMFGLSLGPYVGFRFRASF